MGLFDGFFNFLKDKTLSFSKKSLILFGILLLIFAIDILFGFSFNYSINQRLTQIEKIENLKQNYNLNDTLLSELNIIEKKLITRFDYVKMLHFNEKKSKIDTETCIDTFVVLKTDSLELIDTSSVGLVANLIDTTNVILDSAINQLEIKQKNEKIFKEKKAKQRNWKWDVISSASLYLLIIVFLLIVPFTQTSNFLEVFAGAIILIAVVSVFGWLSYWLLTSIPILWKPWINYILNAILHISSVSVIGTILVNQTKKKKK